MAYGNESGAINVAQADISRAVDALDAAIGILRAQSSVYGWPAVDNPLTHIQNELVILVQKLQAAKELAMMEGQ